jgi:hypothetical protein
MAVLSSDGNLSPPSALLAGMEPTLRPISYKRDRFPADVILTTPVEAPWRQGQRDLMSPKVFCFGRGRPDD